MFDVSLQNTATGFDVELSYVVASVIFSVGGAGTGVAKIRGVGGVATINGII